MRSLPYVLILSLLTAPAALAKPSQRQQSKHAKYIEAKKAQRYAFSPREVKVIREYYAPRYRALPPGLQKKLYRTGKLPPGWQRKLQPLPIVVERRLAPLPPYYRRGVMDGYVVVVDPRRQVLMDVTPVYVK